MTETVGKQIENFFGEFVLYDHKNDTSIWRECMRLKIKLDVRKPLKRKKKITRRNGSEFIVHCKYERLEEFCFVCGMVTHTYRFRGRFLDSRGNDNSKEWGNWLCVRCVGWLLKERVSGCMKTVIGNGRSEMENITNF